MIARTGPFPLLLVVALLAPAAALAEEGAQAKPPSTPAETGPAPAPAAEVKAEPAPAAEVKPEPAPEPFEGPGLAVRAGLGYYEAVNVGVEWRINERHALGAFVGSNLGVPETALNAVGLDWKYIERKVAGFEAAFLVRTQYWTAVDALYRWRLFSAQVGGAFARVMGPGTRLGVDFTLVRTFVVESDRKQDQAFGNPQEWNLSACVTVTHRVASW